MNYNQLQMERVTGIEPAPPAWKAGALPLSYTRTNKTTIARAKVVGEGGFEPPTPWSQTRCAAAAPLPERHNDLSRSNPISYLFAELNLLAKNRIIKITMTRAIT